jgi:molybdopterin/thiamine biosynthesis adenylyltransferase
MNDPQMITVQNPDTAETLKLDIDGGCTIAELAGVIREKTQKKHLLLFTYFRTEAAEKLASRTLVEKDQVFLPDDMTITEVKESLRDPILPIYFRSADLDKELVFKFRTDRFQRVGYNVSLLKTKTVLLGGVGLLGNEVASNLAILGVGQFILIDYGDVDWFNIYRQPLFTVDDVFSKKVTAVEETLLRMGGIGVTPLVMEVPCLATDPSKKTFQESITKLRRHVEESDVIVGAFDIFSARGVLQILSRLAKKPYVSLSLDAWIGEAAIYEPDINNCYCCGHKPGTFADGGACTLATLPAQKIIGSIGSELVVKRLMGRNMEENSFTLYAKDLDLEKAKRKGSAKCVVCGETSDLKPQMSDAEISNWIFDWMFASN